MGQFSHSTAAMPLPPAQAEALYDLTLEIDDKCISKSEDFDAIMKSLPKAMPVPVRQTAPDENPAPRSNGSQTKR
jgi:hypothetical protein